MTFFADVAPIRYAGSESADPFAFRWYDADRVVGGKTMAEHLRVGVCYWHSFTWDGFDIFGAGTLDRPWHPSRSPDLDPMVAARMKMDAAFEFVSKLGAPFFSFHDIDIAPAGSPRFTNSLSSSMDRCGTSRPATSTRRVGTPTSSPPSRPETPGRAAAMAE